MQLTEQQLQQYKEDGYVVVPQLIDAAELAPLRRRLMDFLEGNHDWPDQHFQILDPARFANPRGGFVPVGVQGPSRHEDIFKNIADHPRLQAAMSQLLGGTVQRYTDQALIRKAGLGTTQAGQSFYHQDSYYWRLEPQTGCNVWITLDPVGRDSGALAIMPGTHRNWTLIEHEQYYDDPSYHTATNGKAFQRHRIPNDQIDFSREVVLPMQPGDAVFFTNFTWHRSEKNLTDSHECAYAIAYQRQEK